MFGQQKVFKWLLVLAVFCFFMCGQCMAEAETYTYEEGMRLITMPRDETAPDSVMQITEAYITCDHTMLNVGEEAVWTLNLEGGVPGAYTIDYILLRHAPTDPKNQYSLYSQEMGTTALSYTSLPEDEGSYLMQVFIRDQYDGVLEVFSGVYITNEDALMQKVSEVLSLCKNSGAKTELEIALFMHDYLINNADYDETYTNYMPDGVLLKGSGVCQSYASAYKILLEKSGLQCLYVDGSTGVEEHQWNMVKVDGVWYHVDCTWDDPIGGGNERHSYFLIPDSVLAKDHQWDRAAYPECTDTRYVGAADAGEQTYAGFTFNGGFGDITIKSYNGTEKNVVVPATINGRKVKRVTQNCFLQNNTMETLVISEGVEQLDSLFVALCANLKSISIPSTANLVGLGSGDGIDGLVQGCEAMETIMVADGNPYLCVVDNVLYSKSLTNLIYYPAKSKQTVVRVPDGVQTIKGDAFANNTYLKEVILPDSILSIGYWAFNQCTALEKVNIPENCEFIGQFAFQDTKISEIHIPAATTRIVSNAFSKALRNITVDEANPFFYAVDGVLFTINGDLQCYPPQKPDAQYTIPDIVNRIDAYAFWHASNLVEIEFPQGLERIEPYAFSDCTRLEKVELPASVTYLGNGAFFNCTALGKLLIPPSITEIPAAENLLGNGRGPVIWGEVGSAAHAWAKRYGYAFHDMDQQWEFSGTCGDNIAWTLSEDGTLNINGTGEMVTTNPAPWASHTTLIKKVIVGEGVLSIGDWAFNECRSLTEVHLPESLTKIGERAFASCVALAEIDIPENMTSIGNFGFYSCTAMEEIDIPEAVTWIGDYAFSGCISLKHITLPDNVISIKPYTFWGCRSLADIQLPSNLNSIGVGAFIDCTALTTIDLPDGLYSLEGYYIFQGCTSLTSIRIPDSMSSIASFEFDGCTSLTDLRLSEELHILSDNAFTNSSLTTIVLPSKKEMTIYGNPFEGISATVYCYFGTSFHTWAISNGIEVMPIEIIDFTLPNDCVLQVGTTIQLGATSPDEDMSYLEWYISDQSVATVRKNQLTAVGAGAVTIRLSYEGELIDEMVVTVVNENDGHEWDGGTITVEPSCTTNGMCVYNCSSCDLNKVEVVEGSHSFGDGIITHRPSCDSGGQMVFVCNSCGHFYTEDIPATGHTVVGVDAVAPTCTTSGLTEGKKCLVCQATLSAQIEIPATGHVEENIPAVPATCVSSGWTEATVCITCGATIIDRSTIPPKGHDYGTGVEVLVPTCAGAGLKTYTCAGCSHSYNEVIPAKEHSYVPGETIVASTCTVEGKMLRTCEHCGHSFVESIPALGHTEEIVPGIPATSTTPGLTEGKKCSMCGEIIIAQTEIPPLEHNYGDGVVTLAPTCTADGVKTFVCTVCGDSYTEAISALGHTEDIIPGIPATCIAPGRTEGKRCSTCNITLVAQITIELQEHSYDSGVETETPTCTTSGIKLYTCTVCGGIYSEAIPAKGHAEVPIPAVPATCTVPGLTEGKKCSSCGETLVKQEVVPAKGHAEGDGIVTQEPTASNPGVLSIPCTNCGTILRVESIPATGEPRVSGDADGDGEITIFDALAIFQYVAEERSEINLDNADVDGNGIVNILDALRILQYVSGWNVALL